jgi:hypothetical protein
MHSPCLLYTINRRKYQTKMAMPKFDIQEMVAGDLFAEDVSNQ